MIVSTVGVIDGINPAYMPILELALTPDGNWLIAGEAIANQSFVRFNIKTLEIDDYQIITGNGLRSYTCQTGR